MRQGGWRGNLSKLGRNIQGRVLGSVGFGNIAAEMFGMARSLGFSRLVAADPYASTAAAGAASVELVSMEELLADSDYLATNCFLNASTRGLIGEPELRAHEAQRLFDQHGARTDRKRGRARSCS